MNSIKHLAIKCGITVWENQTRLHLADTEGVSALLVLKDCIKASKILNNQYHRFKFQKYRSQVSVVIAATSIIYNGSVQ